MKKLVLILSFIIGLNFIAHAQLAQRSPEQRAAHMTKVLQKRLNLTRQQAVQVNSVLMTRAARIDSLKNNRSADKKLNQLTRRDITLSTQRNVLAILNDEQKKQFMQFEKMMKQRHKERKAANTVSQG